MVPEITIYVDPTCPHCRRLKDYLTQKRVSFHEQDVTHDFHAQRFLQSKGIDAVPVVRVDDEIIVGFDEGRLNELISTAEVSA